MKRYSWVSFVSLAFGIMACVFIYTYRNPEIMQFGIPINASIGIIFSIIAFFKKSEKKIIALIAFLLCLAALLFLLTVITVAGMGQT
ncbi:hypothetical protein [Sediminibacillus halophilus]|uniref:Uncharacterized protein n=1 Tax=Sediminibacillus halophilus TaxID=482461 RepID=A0A1G9TKJ0_9BACI|nr:hypothetical protein [Sediminibacillus halophilus]SDM48173.1 hypothetical protein SAMN05216244_2623 [Sediminibacillus halophilus]